MKLLTTFFNYIKFRRDLKLLLKLNNSQLYWTEIFINKCKCFSDQTSPFDCEIRNDCKNCFVSNIDHFMVFGVFPIVHKNLMVTHKNKTKLWSYNQLLFKIYQTNPELFLKEIIRVL